MNRKISLKPQQDKFNVHRSRGDGSRDSATRETYNGKNHDVVKFRKSLDREHANPDHSGKQKAKTIALLVYQHNGKGWGSILHRSRE